MTITDDRDARRGRRRPHRLAGVALAALLGATAFLSAGPAHAGPAEDAALGDALDAAASTGFLYEFHGDDQLFDGTRTVPVDTTGKNRLRASTAGTLIVRFQTAATTNQVVVAGGSGTAAGQYGAILANGVPGVDRARVDFPNGMVANLNGPAVTGGWRTVAYSVDGSPGGTTGRTVTSVDGSTTTPFPNYASWFNANPQINALSFLTIGGAPGALANSGATTGFTGRIAFVAFVPQKYSQAQATAITVGQKDTTKAFFRGDATGSDFFRIPFLLNTRDDTLIAGTDANFGSTGDSGENIDAAVRRKPDASLHQAGSGWQAPQLPSSLHMRDYADEPGYKQSSSSVIDGSIVQDVRGSGRIFVHIDLWAWNGGVFEYLNVGADGAAAGGRARNVAYGDGFATIGGKKYLLLSTQNIKGDADGKVGNINNNTDRSRFSLVADVNGAKDPNGRYRIYNLLGTPQPYSSSGTPVSDANLSLGSLTDYTLDPEFVLYKAGVQQTVQQKSSQSGAPRVPMKVFYEDSLLQVYNTSYILQVYSDDDGQTWVSDQIISDMVKVENSRWFILGPGKAVQLQQGPHAGRLVVPVYMQQPGLKTAMIYSDDNGVTWTRGAAIPTSLALHESTIIELPGGGLQAFVRNTSGSGGKVVTATSTDGGASWRDVRSAFGDTGGGVNSQVSALLLEQPMRSPQTGTDVPAFVVTTAMSSARVNGVAHLGLIHADGTYPDGAAKHRVEWVNQFTLTGANERFAYSSMDQLADGRVAMLYETSPSSSWAEGLQAMYYREIEVGLLRE